MNCHCESEYCPGCYPELQPKVEDLIEELRTRIEFLESRVEDLEDRVRTGESST